MQLDEPIGLVAGDDMAGLAQDRVGHEAAAHADAPMNAPDSELDADAGHGFAPGEHVLRW